MIKQTDFFFNGRQAQIEQVLLNLLNNSFDAIQSTPDRWIHITARLENHRVLILVTDSGTGIPNDVQQKMLQPFFTTKEVGKGTGLGLSISKGIIEDHQGQLYYDPKNKNTCFVIDLPEIKKAS